MQITKNSFVVIEYSLRLDDGWFVKGENVPASMNFIAGYGQILPALENGLIGLEQGAQTELKIPGREGFGDRDEGLVRTMSLSEFPAGRDLEPGQHRTFVGLDMRPVGNPGGIAGGLDARDIAFDAIHVDDRGGRTIVAGYADGEGRGHLVASGSASSSLRGAQRRSNPFLPLRLWIASLRSQ